MFGGNAYLSCNYTSFFLHFFSFFDFAMQLFFIPVTIRSSNLCNQAPLFTELRLLQATVIRQVTIMLADGLTFNVALMVIYFCHF